MDDDHTAPNLLKNIIRELWDAEDGAVPNAASVEALNKYLTCESRVPLVDRAVGMLGHGAPELCSQMSSVLVDTLTALLPLLISGGSIQVSPIYPGYRTRLQSLLHHCDTFCASGKSDDADVITLVECLLKVATSVPSCSYEAMAYIYRQDARSPGSWAAWVLRSFLGSLPKQASYYKLGPRFRLYAWRLQPSLLEQDICLFTCEAVQRPLVALRRFVLESDKHKNMVVGLALAPDMSAHVRRRLHLWLLMNGAACIWKVRTELLGVIREVLENPSAWGLELGVHLAPAASLYKQTLQPCLRILNMPPTRAGLVELVDMIEKAESRNQNGISNEGVSAANFVCHDSIWSLQLDYVPWLRFSVQILFCRCTHMARAHETGAENARHWLRTRRMAAGYVHSVMSPTVRQDGAAQLLEIADRWIQLWTLGSGVSCAHGERDDVMDGLNISVAAKAALNVDPVCRKRGRVRDEVDTMNRKMTGAGSMSGILLALRKWFQDFCLACNQHGDLQKSPRSMKFNRFRDGTVQASEDVPLRAADDDDDDDDGGSKRAFVTASCKFSDFVFQAVLSADAILLEREVGCVLLLYVAFGTFMDVDFENCGEFGQGNEMASQNAGAQCHHSTPPCLHCGTVPSLISSREPQHRTERCPVAWQRKVWQQAAKADLDSWVRGAAAIFDMLEANDSSSSAKIAVQANEGGTEVSHRGKVAVLILRYMQELWSKLSRAPQAVLLKDLRDRFHLWINRMQMDANVLQGCSEFVQSLDQQLAII